MQEKIKEVAEHLLEEAKDKNMSPAEKAILIDSFRSLCLSAAECKRETLFITDPPG